MLVRKFSFLLLLLLAAGHTRAAHDKTRANSYDDAWQNGPSGWVANAKTILAGGTNKTAGFTLLLGDSLTNGGGLAWARTGSGKTSEDTAITQWINASGAAITINSKDGFGLATPYICASRSYTVGNGLGAWDLLRSSMPRDDNFTTARQKLLDCTAYPNALNIYTILASFPDVQFAVPEYNLESSSLGFDITDFTAFVDLLISRNIVPIIITYTYRVFHPSYPDFNVWVDNYNTALKQLAQTKKLPLIDFNAELLARRPLSDIRDLTPWIGTYLADGTHYTNGNGQYPPGSNPYTPGGDPATHTTGDAMLFNGYGLKGWLIVQKMKEIKQLVVDSAPPPPPPTGPCNAPTLPITGTRTVNISNVSQLNSAMSNLQNGDTLLLADGTYNLTGSLFVSGKSNVTIRGNSGCDGVQLVGRGMDNPSTGGVDYGIWSDSLNTTIAHLTIRDVYSHPIIFNAGAQSPHMYSVKLLNAGAQFIKVNPTDPVAGTGVDNGILEYSWIEYPSGPPVTDHGSGIGYFNGISAHTADNWIFRKNMFKNLHNPDTAAYLWNPAILIWNGSQNTLTEQNTFINVDRAIAYGLQDRTGTDHLGGTIRNNLIYLQPGFFSAGRKGNSDGAIIVWDSPGTKVYHNTIFTNGNLNSSIEFRFTGTDGEARNNLADLGMSFRQGGTAVQTGNIFSATAAYFVNAAAGDLHLAASAAAAIDQAPTLSAVINDFDGDSRPQGSGYDIGADERAGGSSLSPCDVNRDGQTNAADVQLCRDQTLGLVSPCTCDINQNGLCNVVDVQRVVNAGLAGGTCVTTP